MNAAKFLSAMCCVLASSGPVLAGGSGDSVVSIIQASTPTRAGGNVSVIVQQGSGNYAESDQTGALNTDEIEQFGNNNSSKIVQSGFAGTVVDIQIGNGNQFSVTQTGIDPPPIVIVQRR